VGTDPLTDLAVIKVEGKNLPNAPWGDSTKLAPGPNRAGLRQPVRIPLTVTRGIVSRAEPSIRRPTTPASRASSFRPYAAINPGNSGGRW